MKECPRCNKLRLFEDRCQNALSRRDLKTYICIGCGMEEAKIDLGEKDPDGIELVFIKTHKLSGG